MKLCYAYEWDAADVRTQSGRPFHLLQVLREHCEVVDAFPLNRMPRYAYAPLKWTAQARGRVYHTEREPFMLRFVGRQIDKLIARHRPDVIFAPSSITASAVRKDVPIVYCADCNVYQLFGYYEGFEKIDPRYERHCHEQERLALSRCSAAVFPSEWAAEAAVRISGADPRKVHIVPFGANIEDPGQKSVQALVAERTLRSPRLLFVASSWQRKGGDLVLSTCSMLRECGIPVELDVVGTDAPSSPCPPYVRSHGKLDKNNHDHAALLLNLFTKADLLFVPSRAETFGMTFCEAAAFAIPVISTNTGGISTIVKEGVTGKLLPPSAGPDQYVSVIADTLSSMENYTRMAIAARREYELRLNWQRFSKSLLMILDNVVRSHQMSN